MLPEDPIGEGSERCCYQKSMMDLPKHGQDVDNQDHDEGRPPEVHVQIVLLDSIPEGVGGRDLPGPASLVFGPEPPQQNMPDEVPAVVVQELMPPLVDDLDGLVQARMRCKLTSMTKSKFLTFGYS